MAPEYEFHSVLGLLTKQCMNCKSIITLWVILGN
jgi:hypothetical protein